MCKHFEHFWYPVPVCISVARSAQRLRLGKLINLQQWPSRNHFSIRVVWSLHVCFNVNVDHFTLVTKNRPIKLWSGWIAKNKTKMISRGGTNHSVKKKSWKNYPQKIYTQAKLKSSSFQNERTNPCKKKCTIKASLQEPFQPIDIQNILKKSFHSSF